MVPEAVPAVRTRWSDMPCWGLDAMLEERVSIGGCFTTTFSAAVAAVICCFIIVGGEGQR
eukprot:scaffold16309_cov116-Skeletonema_marinoi.AAC.1